MEALQVVERTLGHAFANRKLLQQALTQRSFSADHNERLEFLGDSVLGLVVSNLLYARLGQATEGEMSRMRANLVRQESLHGIAQKLGLQQALRLGEGELRSGGLQRPSILADVLEAVVGAIYLDAGYPVAERVVQQWFADVDVHSSQAVAAKDGKTALQEWLQARKMDLPRYTVLRIEGAAHQQVFHVECEVTALQLQAQGQGATRRMAEQDAATRMLHVLQGPAYAKLRPQTSSKAKK